jgi:serine/threonine protein phosphatase 1
VGARAACLTSGGSGFMALSRPPRAQRLRVMGRTPNLPPGSRIYAVGDIHGRLDLLEDLLAKIKDDIARRPVERSLHVFLGDYIDRGCCSRDTIDRLIRHGEQNEAVFLKGSRSNA